MTNCTFLRKGELWEKPFIMNEQERTRIKEAIMQRLSEAVDQWLEKEPTLSNGYEYETEFIGFSRRLNKIVLEESLGEVPGGRNGKKKS